MAVSRVEICQNKNQKEKENPSGSHQSCNLSKPKTKKKNITRGRKYLRHTVSRIAVHTYGHGYQPNIQNMAADQKMKKIKVKEYIEKLQV